MDGSSSVFDDEPDPTQALPERLYWLQHAMCVLSRTRLCNETGPQPILPTEMLAYCEMQGIAEEGDRQDLLFFLNELDVIYLKHTHEQIRKAREKEIEKAKRESAKGGRRR